MSSELSTLEAPVSIHGRVPDPPDFESQTLSPSPDALHYLSSVAGFESQTLSPSHDALHYLSSVTATVKRSEPSNRRQKADQISAYLSRSFIYRIQKKRSPD